MIIACNSTSDIDVESEKTVNNEIIDNSIGWALNKDKELLYSCLAKDAEFLVFHPDNSIVIGFDAFKKRVEDVFMQDAFKATSFETKEMRINLSKNGNTAWYSSYLDDYGEWNGQPFGWENARWTGVLEKRENKWVIVQMHFSFPTG